MTFGLGLCYPLSIVELLGCAAWGHGLYQFYQHKDLLRFVLSLFSCDTQQVPQGKKRWGIYLYTSVTPAEKKDWRAWTQFQWKFQMDQIRGASWYVQKCIIPYQLLLLPTIFNYFQLPLWPHSFDEVYKTSHIVDRVAPSQRHSLSQ